MSHVQEGLLVAIHPDGMEPIRVFFYGSFMNRDVLAKVGYHPDRLDVACLDGFDIVVRPMATLVKSDQHAVYGVLATATHAELDRLYGQQWVREYLPEAVIVRTAEGALHPALCYIAPEATANPPFDHYLDRIIEPARQLGFPDWYVQRLERLREPR